jgi:NitT/TauT family transport system substrate-binding protein
MVDTSRPGSGVTRRRALGAGAAAVAAATGLAGCSRREPLLRIASNDWPGYELMHAAQALGRLDESRLRVIEMPSSTDVLMALGSGAIEGGGLTLDELLSARADGLDLCAVLVFDESKGADALVVRPEIRSLAALAGKRIGVEQTATGALVLHAALQAAGLRLDQVQPVYITAASHLVAWQTRQVDALVTFEPVLDAMVAQGGQRLFDSRAMPGQIIDLLVVHNGALQRSPQALRHLVAVHFEMLALWHRDRQTLTPSIGARLGLTPEQVPRLFDGLALPGLPENHQWLAGDPSRLLASARHLEQVMLQARLLTRRAPLTKLCSTRMLPPLTAADAA